MMTFLRLLLITLLGVGGHLFLHSPINSLAAPPLKAKDPGVRLGAPDAGNPLPDLTLSQLAFFEAGKVAFDSEEGVAQGLGPRMNLDSCVGCHSYPAPGGASPFVNPQIAFAKKNGASNIVPSFLSLDGPVREVRFIKNPDGSPDGGVQALFTISGRADAPGCVLIQPDFEAELANGGK